MAFVSTKNQIVYQIMTLNSQHIYCRRLIKKLFSYNIYLCNDNEIKYQIPFINPESFIPRYTLLYQLNPIRARLYIQPLRSMNE